MSVTSKIPLAACPFCGRTPKLDARGVRDHDDCAWTFISCDCRARPHVGESRSWRWPVYEGVSYRMHVGCTKEQAAEEATAAAVAVWNTRAPALSPELRQALLDADTVKDPCPNCRVDRRFYGCFCEKTS